MKISPYMFIYIFCICLYCGCTPVNTNKSLVPQIFATYRKIPSSNTEAETFMVQVYLRYDKKVLMLINSVSQKEPYYQVFYKENESQEIKILTNNCLPENKNIYYHLDYAYHPKTKTWRNFDSSFCQFRISLPKKAKIVKIELKPYFFNYPQGQWYKAAVSN